VAENGVDIVTMVAPGFLGFPHLMSGYMAGVAKLDSNTFVPTSLGTRRALFNSLRRLISRS
jgi:hypothetical protein